MLINKTSLAFIVIAFFSVTILIGPSLLQPIYAPGVDHGPGPVGTITCKLSKMQPSIPVAMNTVALPQDVANLIKTTYVEKEIYDCNVVTASNTLMPYQKLVSIYTKVIDGTGNNPPAEVVSFRVVECTKDLQGNLIIGPDASIARGCIASAPDALTGNPNAPTITSCTIIDEMPIQMNTVVTGQTTVSDIEAEKQVYSCFSNGPHNGPLTHITKEVIIFTKMSEFVHVNSDNNIDEGSNEKFIIATCEKDAKGNVIGCESSLPPDRS